MQHIHISANDRRINLREVWQYRDLIWLFTKRSFIVTYKQTILGPLWLILNPLLTSIVHLILFGTIAKLGTDGVPQLLFYLSGNAMWNYFSSCISKNSSVFTNNVNLFGKVYFPRLVMPISNALSSAIQFFIQLIPALILLVYYTIIGAVSPSIFAIPVILFLLILLGLLGTGLGIVISSLTTKYRDLSVLVSFGISIWLYATPVVYPLSTVSGALKSIILINPVTAPMELYRTVLFGVGTISFPSLLWSLGASLVAAFLGLAIFSKVEKNFIDTV